MFDDKSVQVRRLLATLEWLMSVWAYVVAYWMRFWFGQDVQISDFFHHLALLPFLLAVMLITYSLFDRHDRLRLTSISDYALRVMTALFVGIASLLTCLFVLKIHDISRLVIGIFAVLDAVALVGTRWFIVWWYFSKSVEKGENYLKVLIIGTGSIARDVSEQLRGQQEWGIHIIGHLDPDPARVGGKVLDAPVLGTIDQVESVLKSHVVDEVIVAVPLGMLRNVEAIARACETEGIKLRLTAKAFSFRVARMRLIELGGIPLLTLEPVAQDESMLIIKRVTDLLILILSAPFVLPVMAIIALVVKLDSKGPVFFVQDRVGLHKRIFPMYKFRSMYVGSEARLAEIEHLNEAEGPIFKIKNDPRVTRVGRFLRKTSLDELPQLFNVFRGHMSLVGPRPMSLRDVNLFDEGTQRKRFSVKPGITCLWQISGRSNLPFTKWLELDLRYIDNWSLWLDFKILIKTIPVIIRGTGAV